MCFVVYLFIFFEVSKSSAHVKQKKVSKQASKQTMSRLSEDMAKDLEALIQGLLRDRAEGSVEEKLRKENKSLGDRGKARDKAMDVMELASSYRESGARGSPLRAGDIVTWKRGLASGSLLKEGQLAVVLAVLDEPFTREE